MHLNDLAQKLKIIGEENRLRIICHIFKNKKRCVSEIAKDLNLSIATTSHHLKTLEEQNIVLGTRDGKEICYAIVDSVLMSDFKKLICKYITI